MTKKKEKKCFTFSVKDMSVEYLLILHYSLLGWMDADSHLHNPNPIHAHAHAHDNDNDFGSAVQLRSITLHEHVCMYHFATGARIYIL